MDASTSYEIAVNSEEKETLTEETVSYPNFVGTPTFAELANTFLFVDKSMLIKALFADEAPVVLITAPSRFGKTTNMDMLKNFIEIEMDPDGKQIQLMRDEVSNISEEQPHSKNFDLFKDKKIYTIERYSRRIFDKAFFTMHFGAYPTIYVNFGTVIGDTFDVVLCNLRAAINHSFVQHSYLEGSKNALTNPSDRAKFHKYIDAHETLNEEEIARGLLLLARFLCEHFKCDNKVYVLIDEYDAPITSAMYNEQVSERDMKKTIFMIQGLVGNLINNNSYVKRGLLNGCHHIGGYLSLENITHRPFLQDGIYCEYYGLMEHEVDCLLKKTDLSGKLHELKDWYNGYSTKLPEGNIDTYNTSSIMSYLRVRRAENYWSSGTSRKLTKLFKQDKVKELNYSLMREEIISIKYLPTLETINIANLKKMVTTPNTNTMRANLFFQFLFENGYLDVRKVDQRLQVNIPNMEIYTLFCEALFSLDFFVEYYKTDESDVDTFIEAIKCIPHNIFRLANSIKNLYRNSTSLPRYEFEFQAYLFYLLQKAFDTIEGEAFTQPKTSKKCDIATIVENRIGIVIVTKLFDAESSSDALYEIVENKYYRRICGAQERVCLGIHMSRNTSVSITYLINCNDLAAAKTVRNI